jgi:hypothetical protein
MTFLSESGRGRTASSWADGTHEGVTGGIQAVCSLARVVERSRAAGGLLAKQSVVTGHSSRRLDVVAREEGRGIEGSQRHDRRREVRRARPGGTNMTRPGEWAARRAGSASGGRVSA